MTHGIEMAKSCGYRDINECIKEDISLKARDKVYAECMGKALILFQLGSEPLEKGMDILGAHVDSPHLDIKQNPLYEEQEMAYMDTHYEKDPVLVISDLLIHIAQERMEKKASLVIEGESLDILAGAMTIFEEEKKG